jgi:hypothetical protein
MPPRSRLYSLEPIGIGIFFFFFFFFFKQSVVAPLRSKPMSSGRPDRRERLTCCEPNCWRTIGSPASPLSTWLAQHPDLIRLGMDAVLEHAEAPTLQPERAVQPRDDLLAREVEQAAAVSSGARALEHLPPSAVPVGL